jgi:Xaa-Pro aminopeptidase
MRQPRIDFTEPKTDALIVASLANVQYLTGFDGSNALLLIERSGEMTLFTDPRYTIHAGRVFPGKVVTVKGRSRLALAALKLAVKRKLRKLGFERQHLVYAEYQAMAEELTLGMELVPAGGGIEVQRMVKDASELEQIRNAVHTNSAAFDAAIRKVRPGISELDLAAEIDYQQRRRGASGPAFDTIVAFGERTSLPHAHPGAAKLANNEIILIDAGACQGSYRSDMTRMLSLGNPGNRLKKIYKAVEEAQLAAIAAIREGVSARSVDRVARVVLQSHGLEKEFVHSTGHGLGLEIHESPSLNRKDQTKLAAGMVVTVEPGAYVEGVGGIRIEDTVLVTKTGSEVLTPTRKELIQL